MAQKPMHPMIKYLIPAIIWMALITGLSVMPAPQLPKTPFFAPDKLAHATIYAVFTWLILFGLQRRTKTKLPRKQVIISVVFAAFYGILMEFVQYAFVPGRFFEYGDMLANTIGALLGLSLFIPILLRKRALNPAF
jgi:VanZ family protein